MGVLLFTVLIVVTITKFTHGAYLVFIAMPILYFLMIGVHRYYRDVKREVAVDAETTFGAKGDHAIVLVGTLQKPVLKALDRVQVPSLEKLTGLFALFDPSVSQAFFIHGGHWLAAPVSPPAGWARSLCPISMRATSPCTPCAFRAPVCLRPS